MARTSKEIITSAAKAVYDLLPMQRILPMQWMFNFLTAELPRREIP